MNNIFTITSAELENTNRWLFETVTDSVDVVVRLLTDNEIAVPCIPRYSAGRLVPYFFAGNIRLLFEYARGRKKLSRSLVEKMTLDFYRLMNYSPMSFVREQNADTDEPDDDDDDSRPDPIDDALAFTRSLLPRSIAVILLGANARARVENQCWIDGACLHALTGIPPENADDRRIVKRTRSNGDIEYDPVSVKAALVTLETKEFH